MEELQDASIHHMAAKLLQSIQNQKYYEPLYQSVQVTMVECNTLSV